MKTERFENGAKRKRISVRIRTKTSANMTPYYTRLSPPDRALRKTLLKAYILGKNYVV